MTGASGRRVSAPQVPGQVEGAVESLIIANYFIAARLFEDQVQISATVGTQQAAVSLAACGHYLEVSGHDPLSR